MANGDPRVRQLVDAIEKTRESGRAPTAQELAELHAAVAFLAAEFPEAEVPPPTGQLVTDRAYFSARERIVFERLGFSDGTARWLAKLVAGADRGHGKPAVAAERVGGVVGRLKQQSLVDEGERWALFRRVCGVAAMVFNHLAPALGAWGGLPVQALVSVSNAGGWGLATADSQRRMRRKMAPSRRSLRRRKRDVS